MAEQTGQGESLKTPTAKIVWPERGRGENPETYWTRALEVNLLAEKPDLKAIAATFGRILGQKENREGQDGLTGLKTAPHFLKELDEAVDHAYRQREAGQPEELCVVLVDVDDLKKLNSERGHQKADLVIRAVADLISLGRRKEDTVARMGGDEFAVLLPATDLAGAVKMSQHLSEALKRQIDSTISVGVASLERHDSPAELLEKAQVARELAKGNHVGEYRMPRKGKNRVVAWWEGMPHQIKQE